MLYNYNEQPFVLPWNVLAFSNGFWNLCSGEFGPSTPEQMWSLEKKCQFPWEPPNEKLMNQFENEYLNKILQNAAVKEVHLMQQATGMIGNTFKGSIFLKGQGNVVLSF